MSRQTLFDWLSQHNPIRHRKTTRSRWLVGVPFLRRLRVEPLEDRRLLTIIVDTLIDLDATDGLTTLREAIAAAAPGETIEFDPSLTSGGPATIQLTNAGHAGELAIDKGLTIQGPGANRLTLRAFDPTPIIHMNGDGSRVLNVSNPSGTVTLSGLTFTGGDVQESQTYYGGGGAISNSGDLTIIDSTITGNSSTVSSPYYLYGGGYGGGGGIDNIGGNLTVINSTISGNSTTGGFGGGINNVNYGNLTITNSTISGNTAYVTLGGTYPYYTPYGGYGGGISNARGEMRRSPIAPSPEIGRTSSALEYICGRTLLWK